MLAVNKAKIHQINSCDNVTEAGVEMWRMQFALDTDLSNCDNGKNGQTKDEIRHQVYFLSKDNEHKKPNKPGNNQLSDKTFASAFKAKSDQTAAEIASAQKGWYQHGTVADCVAKKTGVDQKICLELVKTSAGKALYYFWYDFNSGMME